MDQSRWVFPKDSCQNISQGNVQQVNEEWILPQQDEKDQYGGQQEEPTLKNSLQIAEVVPYRPVVDWISCWETQPVRFLERYIPIAVWSGLSVTCLNQTIRYPVGAQKVPEKVRQLFLCPNMKSHSGYTSRLQYETKESWQSGVSTCQIIYELKWKTREKKELFVRFQVAIYGEKCHRCQENYLRGSIQRKALAGVINRFVERIKRKTQIHSIARKPFSSELLIDFASGSSVHNPQSPSVSSSSEDRQNVYCIQKIPKYSLFVNPTDQLFMHHSLRNYYEDKLDSQLRSGVVLNKSQRLRMDWWDFHYIQQLLLQKENRLINFKKDTNHEKNRCEACSLKRCVYADLVEPDNIDYCIIDIDEDELQKPAQYVVKGSPRKQLDEIKFDPLIQDQNPPPKYSLCAQRDLSPMQPQPILKIPEESLTEPQPAYNDPKISRKMRSELAKKQLREKKTARQMEANSQQPPDEPAKLTWKTLATRSNQKSMPTNKKEKKTEENLAVHISQKPAANQSMFVPPQMDFSADLPEHICNSSIISPPVADDSDLRSDPYTADMSQIDFEDLLNKVMQSDTPPIGSS